MKLQYLGTAAAEAFPAVFCHCDTCQRARKSGGKDIRGRSGLVINDTTLIDFPPDIYFMSLRLGLDLGNVRDIFITHSHRDHFCMDELRLRENGMFCHIGKHDNAPLINLYGNDSVEYIVKKFRDGNRKCDGFLSFKKINYGETYRSESGLLFTCLPARHKKPELSCFYMIEEADKRVLYAQDTGVFPEETYSMIAGKRFDLVNLDCCFGKLSSGISDHMGIPENVEMVKRLKEIGCIDDKTIIVINHFSHNCGQLHAELEREVQPYGFTVAYDGMTICV